MKDLLKRCGVFLLAVLLVWTMPVVASAESDDSTGTNYELSETFYETQYLEVGNYEFLLENPEVALDELNSGCYIFSVDMTNISEADSETIIFTNVILYNLYGEKLDEMGIVINNIVAGDMARTAAIGPLEGFELDEVAFYRIVDTESGNVSVGETAVPTSNRCGENLTWTVVDGVLTISGTGDMWNFGESSQPWYEVKDEITTLVLQEGITSIGYCAFYGCNNLKGALKLPEGVISIGYRAFYECSGLNGELIIPESVVEIGSSAFYGCVGLNGELIIPESVTSIRGCAFSKCSGFTGDLTIPKGITIIEAAAFNECTGFTGNLKMPEGIISIESSAFYGCSGLSGKLVIPESVVSIGGLAFSGCNGFSGKLVIPESVTSIGGCAFSGCNGFSGELVIPKGVTSIGYSAFLECSGLRGNVIIPESVISIGSSALRGCSGVDNICLTGNAPSIELKPFDGISGKVYYPSYKTGYEDLIVKLPQYTWIPYGEGEMPWLNDTGNNNESIKAFIERLYTVALNRNADTAGVTNWLNMILTNAYDATGLAREFILGAEFELRNLSNEDYIDVLYKTFFNRDADVDGRAVWLTVLESGQTREYVLSNFVNLDEFKVLCDSYGIERGLMFENGVAANPGVPQFVNRLYDKVMGRDADSAGLYNWVGALVVKTETAESAAVNFFNAQEYAMKKTNSRTYVTDLYNVFMDRDADADGLAFWVSCLDDYGVTRDWVISEFAKSAEFKTIATSYGLE